MDEIAGIIVQEGISAIIYVNGLYATKISGGVYDFVSDKDIDHILNTRIPNSSSLYGFSKKCLKGLAKLICGKKVKDKLETADNLDHIKSIDDIIRHLNKDSVVSIYLIADAPFSLPFGNLSEQTGKTELKPILIRTKYLDIAFELALTFQISDPYEFISNYMVRQKVVTKRDIHEALSSHITQILREELCNEEVSEYGISTEARNRIIHRLMLLNGALHGIEIVGIGDITSKNEDIERFHQVAKQLYCNEKELDFLRRTNEFKNRLVQVTNEQRINESRSNLDLKIALDDINRDGLLHHDEQERFEQLLKNKRSIWNARSNFERDEALNEIAKSRLISDDEMEAFKASLELKKHDRETTDEIVRQQGMASVAMNNLKIQAEVMGVQISAEADTEDAKSDARKRAMANELEELDATEAIYGKKYISQKRRIEEQLEISRIKIDFENNAKIENANVENEIATIKIQGKELEDDYSLNRSWKEAVLRNDIDEINFVNKKRNDEHEWENIRRSHEMHMKMLGAIIDMEECSKVAEHQRKMDEELLHKEEREEAARIELAKQRAELELMKGLTTEQMLAYKEGGSDSKTAQILATNLSSEKALELERQKQQEVEKVRSKYEEQTLNKEQQEREERERREEQRRQDELRREQNQNEIMDKVFGFAQNTVNVTAGIASGTSQRQEERERENFDRFERVSTHRMGEFGEYHNQTMRSHQEYHQQQASYIIEEYGDIPFQLDQVKAMIAKQLVRPQTIVSVAGVKYYAEELPELKGSFSK